MVVDFRVPNVCKLKQRQEHVASASQRLELSSSWLLAAYLCCCCRSVPLSIRFAQTSNTTPQEQASNQSQSPITPSAATATAELKLGEFLPQTRLKVPVTKLNHERWTVVDIHSHFRVKMRRDPEQLDAFVALMDRQNIALSVSLDGMLGPTLDEHIDFLWKKYPDRFAIFANLDWQGSGELDKPDTWACNQPDFAHRCVIGLEQAKSRGVCGLKLFKQFGLHYRNADGSLIAIDDARFDPIWTACGRLGLPIIMHTADPSAFFEPITPLTNATRTVASS